MATGQQPTTERTSQMMTEPFDTCSRAGRPLPPRGLGRAARGVLGRRVGQDAREPIAPVRGYPRRAERWWSLPRPTTRRVSAITLLLGLVTLSASVAPVAIARAPGNDTFGHAAKSGSLPFHKSENTRSAHAQ